MEGQLCKTHRAAFKDKACQTLKPFTDGKDCLSRSFRHVYFKTLRAHKPDPRPSINPEDAKFFEEMGHLTAPKDGQRLITESLLQSLISDNGPYSPSTSVPDIPIAETLYSAKQYEILGFEPSTASMLWNRFISETPGGPDNFFKVISDYLLSPEVVAFEKRSFDSWEFLKALGVGWKYREATLEEGFEDLCDPEYVQVWVLDQIRDVWGLVTRMRVRVAGHRVRVEVWRRRNGMDDSGRDGF